MDLASQASRMRQVDESAPPFLILDIASSSATMALEDDDAMWLKARGFYERVLGGHANGWPVWKMRDVEFYLFTGPNGRWYVGAETQKKEEFSCSTGYIASGEEHGGKMPHLLSKDAWLRYDEEEESWFAEDHIVFVKPEKGAEPVKRPSWRADAVDWSRMRARRSAEEGWNPDMEDDEVMNGDDAKASFAIRDAKATGRDPFFKRHRRRGVSLHHDLIYHTDDVAAMLSEHEREALLEEAQSVKSDCERRARREIMDELAAIQKEVAAERELTQELQNEEAVLDFDLTDLRPRLHMRHQLDAQRRHRGVPAMRQPDHDIHKSPGSLIDMRGKAITNELVCELQDQRSALLAVDIALQTEEKTLQIGCEHMRMEAEESEAVARDAMRLLRDRQKVERDRKLRFSIETREAWGAMRRADLEAMALRVELTGLHASMAETREQIAAEAREAEEKEEELLAELAMLTGRRRQ
eukprot:TRINITY_DN23438_c0_g1_i1.p1 TRINITY_DN23438_c0_g1~~TRINITY_DN23438_c0_g1_i1.p1  ORF type:complete len:469 (-),score=138.01 TRINITY_DN23438_c0_g1_i1:172-1578(-)